MVASTNIFELYTQVCNLSILLYKPSLVTCTGANPVSVVCFGVSSRQPSEAVARLRSTDTTTLLVPSTQRVTKYRLGHDLVRLVDNSASGSRTASYTRADVWVETRTETN